MSLLSRLESLDSFGKTGQDCTAVDYNMELPQPASYTDVHLGHKIPLLPFSRITDYYSSCGKLFEEKYKDLYTERYTSHHASCFLLSA